MARENPLPFSQEELIDVEALVNFGFSQDEAISMLITHRGRRELNQLTTLKNSTLNEKNVLVHPDFKDLSIYSAVGEFNAVKQLSRLEDSVKAKLQSEGGHIELDTPLMSSVSHNLEEMHIHVSFITNRNLFVAVSEKSQPDKYIVSAEFQRERILFRFFGPPPSVLAFDRKVGAWAKQDIAPTIGMLIQASSKLVETV